MAVAVRRLMRYVVEFCEKSKSVSNPINVTYTQLSVYFSSPVSSSATTYYYIYGTPRVNFIKMHYDESRYGLFE